MSSEITKDATAPSPSGETEAAPGVRARQPLYIVGVGASAGGLEAFLALVNALPEDTGMVYVLVQHLDPSHESSLVDLLSRHSVQPVVEAEDGVQVLANHIYVIPPNTAMAIERDELHLTPRSKSRAPQLPVDFFFHSLAENSGERAIGIILSGTGSDGTLGMARIKAGGGTTFVQAPDTAKYDGMPNAAIADGHVDFVSDVERIAEELCRIASFAMQSERAAGGYADGAGDAAKKPYAAILRLLQEEFGVDFSGYRVTTIRRRILRRMMHHHDVALDDYVQRLRDDADELGTLYEDILINVTSFFRDPEIFEALASTTFPAIVEAKAPGTPIRIWVAGCATGQEPYSLAIALVEFLEERQLAPDIQIFATDLSDGRSLSTARDGLYNASIEGEVSPSRLRRFFRREDGGYRIAKSIRDVCVFAKQDIAVDPPFSRLDLISCRNVLIYLSPPLQKRIIPSFHYALNPGGYLLLGSSETVSGFSELFDQVDKQHKIFVRRNTSTRIYPHFTSARRLPHTLARPGTPEWPPTVVDWQREADRIVMGQYAPVGVLVDGNMDILQFRGRTSRYLEPASGDASFNLLKMARDGLFAELRSGVNEARSSQDGVVRQGVAMRIDGAMQHVNLSFMPVTLPNVSDACVLVLFDESAADGEKRDAPRGDGAAGGDGATDGSAAVDLQRAVPVVDRDEEIQRLRRELNATREHQQAILEEREVANEELQTANEEVLSSNEELQSTNEELETAKEELQSLNEELVTVNEQLQSRNSELGHANNDLVNFFGSTHLPIIMVDGNMRLRRYTPAAEKLLYLYPQDIGRPIADIRLAVEIPEVASLVVGVQDTMQRKDLEVQDHSGRWLSVRMRPYRTVDHKVDGVVVALIDIDELKRSQQKYRDLANFADAIVATLHESLLVLDADLRVKSANRTYLETFRVGAEQTKGVKLYDLGKGQWNIAALRNLLEDTLAHDNSVDDFEVRAVFPDIGEKTMLLNARRLDQSHGSETLILLAIEDVTERRRLQEEQVELRARFRTVEAQRHLAAVVESTDDAIISVDNDGNIRSWNRGATSMFGYEEEAMVGEPIFALSAPKIRKQNETFFRALLEEQKQGHFDTIYVDSENRKVEVSITACPMFDDDGNLTGGSVIARDISRARRMAKELSQADRRKNEFVAMLAHELRNPLAAISSAIDLLSVRGGAERLDSIRAIIARQTGNLTQLVDDLLDISRITSGVIQLRKGVVDLATPVARAAETVAPMMAARGHELQVSLEDEPLWVEGDATRLEQAIANLLVNSAKYTPPRGHVSLVANKAGQTIRLRVRDDGIGISAEQLPHVFEMFSRSRRSSDPQASGLGIGLALVKSLIEMHGGSVEAASEGEDAGSEFTICLPAMLDHADDKLDRDSEEAPPSVVTPRRIVLVDDNEDAASAMSQLLEITGHEVHVAYSGPDGFDAVVQHRPHVVLLDISLPGLDGYGVARQIRARPELAPVTLIAISGYCQESDRRRSHEAGFDHHLAKPADTKMLLKLIEAADVGGEDGAS